MIPGSAQFAGMNEAQRNAIVQALLAQAGTPAPAPAEVLNPYQDIVDPSDPASYDSTLGEVVGSLQSPTSPNTALGFLMGDYDAAINAPTPSNVIDAITVSPPSITQPDPAQPAQIDDQGNPAPPDFSTPTNTPAPPAPPDVNESNPGLNEAGLAISQNVDSLSALNESVNDAVDAAMASPQGFGGLVNAGYTSDPGGFTSDPGGFGTGTGFSSADAANSAVSGALADAGIAAGVAGLGEGGTGEGGGGGGDGGK